MNNFKKEGFRKGGSGFGGKSSFGGPKKFGGIGRGHDRGHGRSEDRGDRPELFNTTCTACGKSCDVPFRPSGDKPVYCRECFAEKGPNDNRVGRTNDRSDSRGDFRSDSRPNRDERPAKHEHAQAPRDTRIDALKEQVSKLESKIDTILGLLKTTQTPKTETKVGTPIVTEVTEEAPLKKVRKPKTVKVKVKSPAKKKVAKKKTK